MIYPAGIEIGVLSIPLNDSGQILICKSNEGRGWTFAGGHLEVGEKIEHCLARETLEELGIEIDIFGRLDFIELIYTRGNGDGRHVIVVPFVTRIRPDQEIKLDGKEISEVKWVSLDDAESSLNKHYVKCIAPLRNWLQEMGLK